MPGRSHRMDAVPHAPGRAPRVRAMCALAGLLCTLGLLFVGAQHGAHAPEHRAHVLVAAATATPDSHHPGVAHVVATAAVAQQTAARWSAGVTAGTSAASDRSAETVRTRGPPATQA